MPKNKTGGRNNRKRASKHAQPLIRTNVRLAKDDAEMYAIVVKLCGNGRADVKCADGVTRLLEIRKKFRGRNKRDNMIAMGTMILVGERDWEVRAANKKEKVDLLYVYSAGQHDALKKEKAAQMLLGVENDESDIGGFDISNTETWKQKIEETENEGKSLSTDTPVGMKPLEDEDFDFDDI